MLPNGKYVVSVSPPDFGLVLVEAMNFYPGSHGCALSLEVMVSVEGEVIER